MIFRFVIRAADLEAADKNTLNNAISGLLLAHRMGRHLFIMDRHTSEWCVKNLDLNEREKATARSIASDYTQNGTLHLSASLFVEVRISGLQAESGKIVLGLSYLLESEILEKSCLISESANTDGRLYLELMRIIAKRNGIPRPSGALVHGGGDEIVEIFKSHVERKVVAVAIVDSDKKCPDCSGGGKYQRCRGKLNVSWPLSFVYQTPCREIENMISTQVQGMVAPHGSERYFEWIGVIEENERRDGTGYSKKLCFFIDVKNGIDRERFDRLTEPTKSWYQDKLVAAGVDLEVEPIQGIGSGIVSAVLSNGPHWTEFKKSISDSSWNGLFGRMFTEAAWILAAPEPNRV